MTTLSAPKRLLKNSLFLYFRMGLMMALSLFTSRVILQTLGEENFGIYNVVGGVVVLFSFISGSMQNATQRFLNIELGGGDQEQAGKVFNNSLQVHFVFAGIIFILAETIGLWFLTHKLKIPAGRMGAAHWVYQFSIITTVVNIVTMPYLSAIVAYERFDFYAIQSLITAVLKLVIVYLLLIGQLDKLILYAFLVLVVSILGQAMVMLYCRWQFTLTRWQRGEWDCALFKEMFAYSGWNFFGGISILASSQGLNMMLNMFCGVGVNAAMGIANQVNGAVSQFVSGFQQSYAPQIVQSYVADRNYFLKLLFVATKFSFLLMLFFGLPVIVNIDFLLGIWLKEVPQWSNDFAIWILIYGLIGTMANPLWSAIVATGKIKIDQIREACFVFFSLPIAYMLLRLGYSPVWVLVIRTLVYFCYNILRIFYLRDKVGLPSWDFFFNVFCRCILGAGLAALLPFWVVVQFTGWQAFIASGFASVLSVCFFSWFVIIKKSERVYLVDKIGGFIKAKLS